ncbi:hypothetical protein KEM48_013465 [Puccinia striiformis f. sp. tritici PST-130]|nr:hypothetical protein KEM48_013465 [Puccinia striiformis f. sp. tritici PST-130]
MSVKLARTLSLPPPTSNKPTFADLINHHMFVDQLTRMRVIDNQRDVALDNNLGKAIADRHKIADNLINRSQPPSIEEIQSCMEALLRKSEARTKETLQDKLDESESRANKMMEDQLDASESRTQVALKLFVYETLDCETLLPNVQLRQANTDIAAIQAQTPPGQRGNYRNSSSTLPGQRRHY